MFNLWSFKGIGALVSSGLGGGSLIYANVLLRKDEKWFVQEDLADGGYEHWPVTRETLDPHYDAAEEMLNAQRYPFEHAVRPLVEDRRLQEAAGSSGASGSSRRWPSPSRTRTRTRRSACPSARSTRTSTGFRATRAA